MKFFNLKPIDLVKGSLTVALATGMIFLVVSDYRKLQQKYPGNAFISYIFIEQEKVKEKAKLINLNQAVPHYYENLFHIANGEPEIESPDSLPTYTRYFEKITEYMPYLPEGYGLLAFCYYYDYDHKKKTEAAALYEKAIALNPHVVWFYYNLGVVHFKDRQYAQAMTAFQRALNVDVNLSVKFVLSSKLFQDILRERNLSIPHIEEGVRTVLSNTRVLLGLSVYRLGNPGGAANVPLENDLYLRIF